MLSAHTEFTNNCCRLLIKLDFCFIACALCVLLVQKHRLQDIYATVLWHCQSAVDQSDPIQCYDFFYKNIIVTSLNQEYLTDSVKIKLPPVDMFTYGYMQKIS